MSSLTSIVALLLSTSLACGDDDAPVPMPDAGSPPDSALDAPTDVEVPGDGTICETQPLLAFKEPAVGTVPGRARTLRIAIDSEFACGPVELSLSSADAAIATVETATATIASGTSETNIVVRGVAAGRATITARWAPSHGVQTATIDVVVVPPTVPPCDGTASGRVMPGGSVAVASGALAGVHVAVPPGAGEERYRVPALDVTIGCAPDQVPSGYVALGPAVAFGPATTRLLRDIPMSIPVALALLPEGAHRGHVELAYTGLGAATPRTVPVAFFDWTDDGLGGRLIFEAPRFGTYQAVARTTAGTPRQRTFKYRGMTGISMGGGGTGVVGLRHLDRFDFIAPLGAAWDWQYLLEYMRLYHLGGFCTEAERTANPTACAGGASAARVPARRYAHEHIQHFEHWWYDEAVGGQGGSFDRGEYISILRDLTMMFGNPNTDRAENETAPNVTPPGVPDTERARDLAERCAMPVVIPPYNGTAATGYFDDEYNPEGLHPVITFCDGAEQRPGGETDLGFWDPDGNNNLPTEILLAVDLDRDGRRDPGEPVIRSMREPFDDCGMDRTCNAAEPGYDATSNPDPAGDDFDPQYNPGGTEGNATRDGDPCQPMNGEAFRDVGFDGVMGTMQLVAGGFDRGEGNGCWDLTRGARRMYERGPRGLLARATPAELLDLDVFADGGIRDLFVGPTASDMMASPLAARGLGLRYYNSHASLLVTGSHNDEDFAYTSIPWAETGKYFVLRYGDPEAEPARRDEGDGAHVGTISQTVNRILAATAWMSARWPGGDRRFVEDTICTSGGIRCTQPNQILLDFTSPTTGRTGPATIILPPGYYAPEFANTRYPVVVFLHGYGQEPGDLLASGILFWNFMIARTIAVSDRFQKMIFVFPDGRCREGECVKGTFFTDAPASTPMGGQLETFLLDLLDYVDATYRTKQPETVTVVD